MRDVYSPSLGLEVIESGFVGGWAGLHVGSVMLNLWLSIVDLFFPFFKQFVAVVVDKFCNVNALVIDGLNEFPLWEGWITQGVLIFARTFLCGANFNVQGNKRISWMNHILKRQMAFKD